MMNISLFDWFRSFDWQMILDTYGNLTPLIPIFVVALESLVPAFPLTAIVAWNVAAYGVYLGSLYSWIGTCLGCTGVFLFWRAVLGTRSEKYAVNHEKAAKAHAFVRRIKPRALFLILMMPFTPSAFMNFAFGISKYDPYQYLLTLYFSKIVMISLLALIGQSIVLSAEEPLFIVTAVILLTILIWLSRKAYHLSDPGQGNEDQRD